MLKLAITLLATALCFTPIAKSAEAPQEKQDLPSFSHTIKKAYYDPTETYGTTDYTFYNYSSQTLSVGWNNGQNSETLEPNESYTRTDYGKNTICVINSITSEDYANLDIYLNGDLQTYTYANPVIMLNSAQGYLWFFDHGQPINPAEEVPQDIFEAVGDTIEGLSTALTSPWQGLLNIFYDTTEQELTPFGEVSLIVAGTTVVFFLFGLVITLFRQRK